MAELELPPVERVCAYTPREGDTVVLTVREGHSVTQEMAHRLKELAEKHFGAGIKVMVLGAGVEFSGVIGPERESA